MEAVKLMFFAIAASMIFIILKRLSGEYAMFVCTAAVVLLMIPVIIQINELTDKIEDYASAVGINNSYIKVLIKATGICIICEFASSFCRDSGSDSLSKGVELLGKTAILLISLPLFGEIINTVIGFIK